MCQETSGTGISAGMSHAGASNLRCYWKHLVSQVHIDAFNIQIYEFCQ